MPAHSSRVIPKLPGTLSVSMLSPGFDKVPAKNFLKLKECRVQGVRKLGVSGNVSGLSNVDVFGLMQLL